MTTAGSIGMTEPILYFGSEEQKKKFLPKLTTTDACSAFVLTEPSPAEPRKK